MVYVLGTTCLIFAVLQFLFVRSDNEIVKALHAIDLTLLLIAAIFAFK